MEFPKLNTGAVAQYPAQRRVSFRTEVLRFIDGTEQRFRQRSGPLHSWTIRLDLLNEQEILSLQTFFGAAKGRQGDFAFTDPWDGATYPNCSLDIDNLEGAYSGELRSSTELVVRENV